MNRKIDFAEIYAVNDVISMDFANHSLLTLIVSVGQAVKDTNNLAKIRDLFSF